MPVALVNQELGGVDLAGDGGQVAVVGAVQPFQVGQAASAVALSWTSGSPEDRGLGLGEGQGGAALTGSSSTIQHFDETGLPTVEEHAAADIADRPGHRPSPGLRRIGPAASAGRVQVAVPRGRPSGRGCGHER